MEEKPDIFISYRREGGVHAAKEIALELRERGYSVFFDGKSISSGRFWDTIRESVEACSDFLVVLTPGALDRCAAGSEIDFVAREISLAMSLGKNIVPVMTDGFSFPDPMPECIRGLEEYNAGDSVNVSKPQAIEQMLDFKIKYDFFCSRPRREVAANTADALRRTSGAGSRRNVSSGSKSALVGFFALLAACIAAGLGFAWIRIRGGDAPAPENVAVGDSAAGTSGKGADSLFSSDESKEKEEDAPSEGTSGEPEETPPADESGTVPKSETPGENASSETPGTPARASSDPTESGTHSESEPPSGPAAPSKYTAVRGDTLDRIARKLGCSAEALRAANPDVDFIHLRKGTKLNVPVDSASER